MQSTLFLYQREVVPLVILVSLILKKNIRINIFITTYICGVVLWEHYKIIERWKVYYGKLLNEEKPMAVFGDVLPNQGLTPAINRKEVEVALKE